MNHARPTSFTSPVGPCGRPIPVDRDAMLYPAEAAALLGLAVRTLEADRLRHRLSLPFFRFGARAIRYRRGDLEAWLAARRCGGEPEV